ncbi:PIN domain-containing protein [Azotobacter chroococcum]|uniref:Uncharacterized protein DUF4935 n=1 Tax=Azotobacter chroococcum TaxID=353 RepID=A0A4R1PHE8_9GAMM|nr:PIN domain-containing protein [Azotobacter chroococcum]TBV96715.1 DUF4935 domain-containing protein [Azotobacter chroococcum]TCL27176.1 uncharacterized protein DUF4935 [Azotobacter chroococcum]
MKVFLDTNAFYKNWFASNANFKLLFYFLNNEQHELLLSDLVAQETNNIRERELNEIKSELSRLIKKGEQLNSRNLKFTIDDLGFQPYDLVKILKEKVDWIDSIEYDCIPQSKVVERAIKLVKPFSNQEKGYRDTLIWLSFLNYLSSNKIEGNVAFITNNKHDFFQSNGNNLSFNNDLLRDIEEYKIKANIRPYLNIYDFVNENVDKISHSFDRHEILDNLEHFLISETEDYLNSMSNGDISQLLDNKVFSDKLTPVIDIESDVFEGLEDPEVKSVKRLSGDNVYIEAYFEMRSVDLAITIDAIEYKQYASEIESTKSLYNINIEDDHAKLSFILRTCIDGSFEYDTKNETASNLSVDSIFNRRSRSES